MKKQILILGLSFMTTVVFANEAKTKEKKEAQEPVTKCCTQSANNGVSGAGYVSVTVTSCVTNESGNHHAASVGACSLSSARANKALENIKNLPQIVTVY